MMQADICRSLRATTSVAALAMWFYPEVGHADGFCSGLATVVADAPRNFVSIRGQADRSTGYFTRPYLMPEAGPYYPNGLTCIAAEFPPNGGKFEYACVFEGPRGGVAEAKAQFASFVRRVETCLNLPHQAFDLSAPADQGRLGSANRGPISLAVPEGVVRLSLEYPPDGGLGIYVVSVEGR